MADSHKLVFNLLPFCLKLHIVRKRLPAAAAADAKMRAERFQAVLRRLYNPFYPAFHIVFLLFEDLDVKIVDAFPDQCGKIKLVESFPDVKIQIVNSFPDIKVKIVDAFPGVRK